MIQSVTQKRNPDLFCDLLHHYYYVYAKKMCILTIMLITIMILVTIIVIWKFPCISSLQCILCVQETEYVYVWKAERECTQSNLCFLIPMPLILTEAHKIFQCKSIPDSLEAETQKLPRMRKPHTSPSLFHHFCHSLPLHDSFNHMSDIFCNQSEVSPTQPAPMMHCLCVNISTVQNRPHLTAVVNKFVPQVLFVYCIKSTVYKLGDAVHT